MPGIRVEEVCKTEKSLLALFCPGVFVRTLSPAAQCADKAVAEALRSHTDMCEDATAAWLHTRGLLALILRRIQKVKTSPEHFHLPSDR